MGSCHGGGGGGGGGTGKQQWHWWPHPPLHLGDDGKISTKWIILSFFFSWLLSEFIHFYQVGFVDGVNFFYL